MSVLISVLIMYCGIVLLFGELVVIMKLLCELLVVCLNMIVGVIELCGCLFGCRWLVIGLLDVLSGFVEKLVNWLFSRKLLVMWNEFMFDLIVVVVFSMLLLLFMIVNWFVLCLISVVLMLSGIVLRLLGCVVFMFLVVLISVVCDFRYGLFSSVFYVLFGSGMKLVLVMYLLWFV